MPKIYIIAGEASGDLIGSKLIAELKKKVKKNLVLQGIGGPKMIAKGCRSLFDIKDLSIMGFTEVIPAIPRILWRMKQTINDIKKFAPDIIVTIDSPGFNFRIAQKLHKEFPGQMKIVHYVAPTVWAYKPERVNIIKKYFCHLLAILPFEKKYFDKVKAPCTFIGHPILENHKPSKNKDSNKILLMPGSRVNEIKRHLKVFTEVANTLHEQNPKLKFYIPTFERFAKKIDRMTKGLDHFVVVTDAKAKDTIMKKCGFAIVKSGTSAVEMMREETPCAVGYKMNALTYRFIRNKIKVKYITLTNLILNTEVVKEYIQKECTASNIHTEMQQLMNDEKYRNEQIKAYKKAKAKMLPKGFTPSKTAAKVILEQL